MTREEQLIKLYKDAQQELVDTIAYHKARGVLTVYQESLLRQINAILAALMAESNRISDEMVMEEYDASIEQTLEGLRLLGVDGSTLDHSFSRIREEAINVLADNMKESLNAANRFVGRRIYDAVREIGLQQTFTRLSTGQTVREAQRQLQERLAANGVSHIMDRRGRRIPLDAYASLVARSTSAEATNTATMNSLGYLGYDLVQMTSHATTCSVCAAYQGRVYSVSGNHPSYPPLDAAFGGGYANIHPNCRHRLAPYVEALAKNRDADREFSNRPFDIDPRSAAEKKRYDDEQKEKRALRKDRNQWERYKVVLGEEAPKTLAGFRKMKLAESPRWLELKAKYKEASTNGGS